MTARRKTKIVVANMLKNTAKTLQISLLMLTLASCERAGLDVFELSRQKQSDLAQAQDQLLKHLAKSSETEKRILEEAIELSKIKTAQFNRGENWEETNARTLELVEELKPISEKTEQLMSEVAELSTDSIGLLGSIYSHCGEDARTVVDNIVLTPYKANPSESGRLEKLFWEKKWEYDELIKESNADIVCTTGIPKVKQFLSALQKRANKVQ